MKTRVFVLFCFLAFCLLLTSCNHEAPTNVIGENYNIQTIAKRNDDGTITYNVYLPATWCSESPDGKVLPFINSYFGGYKTEKLISQYEIQNPTFGFENYYKFENTLGDKDVREIVLTYGNYINPDNPFDMNKADLINHKYNRFIKLYQPTGIASDEEYVIALRFVEGRFEELDPNTFIPLSGIINISGDLRVNQTVYFNIDDLRCTGIIGYKKIEWVFSDGYIREGRSFDIKFDKAEKNMFVDLKLIDNLYKTKTIRRYFSIND